MYVQGLQPLMYVSQEGGYWKGYNYLFDRRFEQQVVPLKIKKALAGHRHRQIQQPTAQRQNTGQEAECQQTGRQHAGEGHTQVQMNTNALDWKTRNDTGVWQKPFYLQGGYN